MHLPLPVTSTENRHSLTPITCLKPPSPSNLRGIRWPKKPFLQRLSPLSVFSCRQTRTGFSSFLFNNISGSCQGLWKKPFIRIIEGSSDIGKHNKACVSPSRISHVLPRSCWNWCVDQQNVRFRFSVISIAFAQLKYLLVPIRTWSSWIDFCCVQVQGYNIKVLSRLSVKLALWPRHNRLNADV